MSFIGFLKKMAIALSVLWLAACAYLYIYQENHLFSPVVASQELKWDLKGDSRTYPEAQVEEFFFPSPLHGHINALSVRLPSSKGFIFYIHGTGGNIQTILNQRHVFLQAGWDFFVFDYRGYGKSTGPISEQGFYADVKAAWNFAQVYYGNSPAIVYGQSLGTGFATRLSQEYSPHILILESPYTSLADLTQSKIPWLPVRYILKYPIESKKHLEKVSCPVFVFHGTNDGLIPISFGQEMARSAQDGHFIFCKNMGHDACPRLPQDVEKLKKILASSAHNLEHQSRME